MKNSVGLAFGAAFLLSCATAGLTPKTDGDDASASESPPPAPACFACDGVCVDEQSDQGNCGACGVRCAGPCELGVCAPCVPCNGACVDDQNDSNNCGGCGVVCVGSCQLGRCIAVAAGGQSVAGSLLVDDANANLYWTDSTDAGAIVRAPLDGGEPVPIASGFSFPSSLAIDGERAYWTTVDACDGAQDECVGRVMSAPLVGGTAVTLATGAWLATSIAVDTTSLYWINGAPPGEILTMPVDGGPVTALFTGPDAGTLFDKPETIAVGGSTVYWMGDDVLESEPVSGGPVSPVSGASMLKNVDGVASETGFTIQGTTIYLTGSNPASPAAVLYAIPMDGGAPTMLASDPGQAYGAVVSDGVNAYWVSDSSSIKKVPINGGGTTEIVSGQSIDALAVDATSVYWTDPSNNTVMKVTPK